MIIVTIAGVDRTASIIAGSLRKTDHLNQQVDQLDFKVRKYGTLTYSPSLGEEVVVTRNGVTIYGGVVVRITETVAASKILTYKIECADYSQYLKRELVTERYESTTVGTIISDLIASYTSEGFTTVNVIGTLPIESISFNRLSVADSLQKLADAISYVWYVDYDMDIHFFPKNTEAGPSLSDASGNYIFDSLEIVEDMTQVRNSVLVQGGEAKSETARTETFDGDGTKNHFALANKFAGVPTVTVDSVAQTVGVEFLDDDSSFDCMWNFNEKYIRFTSGNTPASGSNNVEIEGIYLYPIVVRVPAPSSIALFGTYEFALTDKSIKSQDEAIARAQAELRSYQNSLHEGHFRTYENGFRSGQVIEISSVQRGKTISVLIQSVSAIMRDPMGESLEYNVRFATLKSIGIIEYLQNQLRSNEVIVDDEETLLGFFPLDDTVTTSDGLAAPSTSTGPYTWGNFNWGYGTWS
jgi:hypothetical protein